MRKDSLFVFVTSIALTLGIIGSAYYFFLEGQNKPFKPTPVQPHSTSGAEQAKKVTAQPVDRRATGRTSTPIKCTKADGSDFWTNATRCQDADLHNRLSFADPVKPIPRMQKNRVTSKSSASARPEKKELKRITNDLTIPCRYSIGMARKIETRSLRLKDDPAESIWKESYCGWVCEARVENCGNLDEYLRLVRLCPRRPYMSKRACRT